MSQNRIKDSTPNQLKEEISENWVRRNNPQYAHMDDQEIRNMLT